MRLVKFLVTASLAVTFSVSAGQYKLQDNGPVYWQQRDRLVQYMKQTGKCVELSRIGDSPTQYAHQVSIVLSKFADDKVRMYVPYMTYSCMISGEPTYAGYIPEHYVKKMPR
jgi:hypothetical protein